MDHAKAIAVIIFASIAMSWAVFYILKNQRDDEP
jgi:hypothetical protein